MLSGFDDRIDCVLSGFDDSIRVPAAERRQGGREGRPRPVATPPRRHARPHRPDVSAPQAQRQSERL